MDRTNSRVVSHVPSVSNVCLTCASWRRRTAKHAHFSDDLACNAPARRPPCVCRLTPRCVCEPTVNGGSLLFTSVAWLAQTCTFLATGGRRRDAPVQPAFACACAGTVFICLSCAKRCHRGTTALCGEQSTVRLNIVWRWRVSLCEQQGTISRSLGCEPRIAIAGTSSRQSRSAASRCLGDVCNGCFLLLLQGPFVSIYRCDTNSNGAAPSYQQLRFWTPSPSPGIGVESSS